MAGLIRDDSVLIKPETRIFFRDIHDQAVQAMDIVVRFRDPASSLMKLHLSRNSQRMNETIKVLTLAATIFIPLTFITGVCGKLRVHARTALVMGLSPGPLVHAGPGHGHAAVFQTQTLVVTFPFTMQAGLPNISVMRARGSAGE